MHRSGDKARNHLYGYALFILLSLRHDCIEEAIDPYEDY
jgi:hypothetical protein